MFISYTTNAQKKRKDLVHSTTDKFAYLGPELGIWKKFKFDALLGSLSQAVETGQGLFSSFCAFGIVCLCLFFFGALFSVHPVDFAVDKDLSFGEFGVRERTFKRKVVTVKDGKAEAKTAYLYELLCNAYSLGGMHAIHIVWPQRKFKRRRKILLRSRSLL